MRSRHGEEAEMTMSMREEGEVMMITSVVIEGGVAAGAAGRGCGTHHGVKMRLLKLGDRAEVVRVGPLPPGLRKEVVEIEAPINPADKVARIVRRLSPAGLAF